MEPFVELMKIFLPAILVFFTAFIFFNKAQKKRPIDSQHKAETIKIGITTSNILSFSINIFLIAGSSNQATAEVAVAEIKIKTKIMIICDKYFLICVLKILFRRSTFSISIYMQ